MYTKQGLDVSYAKRISEIEKLLFLPYKAASYEKCLCFLKTEKNSYIGLFNDDNILIGYLNCLPLKKDVYDAYKNSEITETDINENNLDIYHKGDNYCLIEPIAVIPEYQKTKGVKLIVETFYDFANKQKEKGIIIKEVIGDCVSQAGENFMKRTFNAKLHKKSDWGNIYCGTVQY